MKIKCNITDFCHIYDVTSKRLAHPQHRGNPNPTHDKLFCVGIISTRCLITEERERKLCFTEEDGAVAEHYPIVYIVTHCHLSGQPLCTDLLCLAGQGKVCNGSIA